MISQGWDSIRLDKQNGNTAMQEGNVEKQVAYKSRELAAPRYTSSAAMLPLWWELFKAS